MAWSRPQPEPGPAPAKWIDETGIAWPKGQTPYVVERGGKLHRVTGDEYRRIKSDEQRKSAADAYRALADAATPDPDPSTPDTPTQESE